MKKSKPATEFWTVVTMVNLLGLIYPIDLLLRANSVDENLFATSVLVGSIFLLSLLHRGSPRPAGCKTGSEAW
jgi:hypothetical protein